MGKKENKEKKPQACEAYIARIQSLEKDIEMYRKDGEKLGDEILSLRRSVSSYKSANTVLRRKVDELTKKAEHNRDVDVEGDHLYEEALAKIEDMKKTELGLSDQVAKLTTRLIEVDSEKESLKKELEEEKAKPWYKKIF